MTVLAFDLGGTRLKAGLVEDGAVVAHEERPSPAGDAALEELTAVGRALLGDGTPDGVGLAVPGLVEDGAIVSLPGKLQGLAGLDLAKGLRAAFDVEPVVVNDALAYGIGEARAGAGAGHERVVVVTLGTGVGVAVLQGGEPVTGGVTGGGILGGMIPIGPDEGPIDTAGSRGTIEALCRAPRLAELAGRATVEEVYAAHAAGDERARDALTTVRADLTRALVALAHAHAPGCIVVGGGPITGDDPLLPGIAGDVRARLFPGTTVEVRAALLGDAAALVGLSHLVR